MLEIAERIRIARKAAGLSQQDVVGLISSNGVFISQGTLSSIESGKNRGRKYRRAIAEALGVRLEWLQTGKGHMYDARPPPARIAEPDKDYNIGQLLYEMAGDLHALREDCRALHQRMARLEAEAGAAHDHSGANAG